MSIDNQISITIVMADGSVRKVGPRVRQFAPLKRRFLLQKQALALDPRIFCGGTF